MNGRRPEGWNRHPDRDSVEDCAGAREHFLEHLSENWPELASKYREPYAGRAYLGAEVVKPVKRRVATLANELGVADRRVPPVVPEAEREQLALAV